MAAILSLGFTSIATYASSAPGLATTNADTRSATTLGRAHCTALALSGRRREQAAFAAASRANRVPRNLLLAVSYLESRWDDHGTAASSSGGFGPLNLTDARGHRAADHTLALAARLTGRSRRALKRIVATNVCGGAAVLAHDQRELGGPVGVRTSLSSWTRAVEAYSGGHSAASRQLFARQVYSTLRTGQSRRTNVGQVLRLGSSKDVSVPTLTATSITPDDGYFPDPTDCPVILRCQWVVAPHVQYGDGPGDYGNWDWADRVSEKQIKYIVIHASGLSWASDLERVQNPRWASWNFTVRQDGQIAEHVPLDDIARHAGNWWFNMHSIGIENEAEYPYQGWWTESELETSATLVGHLARELGIPLDRAHIIGEDQVPAGGPSTLGTMKSDPGPFWDWQHYMDLMHAPIEGSQTAKANQVFVPGDVVTVKTTQYFPTVTGCPGATDHCDGEYDNFVYVRQSPSDDAPLVSDPGVDPEGSPATTDVNDVSARAVDGEQLVVTGVVGDWVSVDWLGRTGWIHNIKTFNGRMLVPATGSLQLATPKTGLDKVPLYGRAYPERAAYPAGVPYADVSPLPYQMRSGQHLVVASPNIVSDYCRATFNQTCDKYNNTATGHHLYDELWDGHRLLFVLASDVDVATSTTANVNSGESK